MLISKTTNRKVYRITNVINNQGYLRLELDDYVSYSNGNRRQIDIKSHHYGYYNSYGNYQVDRYVEIDNSKTRHERSGHEFSDDGSVIRTSDINAALVHRAREEFANIQSQNSSLETQNANLQNLINIGKNQLDEKNRQIATRDDQIDKFATQIKEDRAGYKITEEKYEELRGLFTGLQIQNNNKDQEIGKKEDENEELRGGLNDSKAKILDLKIKDKETKLEKLIKKIGIERKESHELKKLYRQLTIAREDDYNQDKIDDIEEKINETRERLIDESKIDIDDVQEFFGKCEKIAKWKIEHSKLLKQKQQYQARQEVPPKNN